MVTNRIRIQDCRWDTVIDMHGQRSTVVIVPTELLPAFTQLISRGINTWDQAPQEIKAFVDELTGNNKLVSSHERNTAKFFNEQYLLQSCQRSHPHENMSAACVAITAFEMAKRERTSITCHCKPLGAVCEYPFCQSTLENKSSRD